MLTHFRAQLFDSYPASACTAASFPDSSKRSTTSLRTARLGWSSSSFSVLSSDGLLRMLRLRMHTPSSLFQITTTFACTSSKHIAIHRGESKCLQNGASSKLQPGVLASNDATTPELRPVTATKANRPSLALQAISEWIKGQTVTSGVFPQHKVGSGFVDSTSFLVLLCTHSYSLHFARCKLELELSPSQINMIPLSPPAQQYRLFFYKYHISTHLFWSPNLSMSLGNFVEPLSSYGFNKTHREPPFLAGLWGAKAQQTHTCVFS